MIRKMPRWLGLFFALPLFLIMLTNALLLYSRQQPSEARFIAHSDFWHGDSEIYLAIPGSHYQVNLTRSPAFDTQPTWSPDGQWVAFVSDRERHEGGPPLNNVYIMRPDGSGLQKMGVSSPATGTRMMRWSPDSQWLFVKYVTRGWWDGYFVRIADGHHQSLRDFGTFTLAGNWSPDGKWVAYRTGMEQDPQTSIVRVHPDDSAVIVDIQTLVASTNYIDNLFWSPDAQKIAFTSFERREEGHSFLHVINVDGSALQVLYDSPFPVGDVVWSSDAKMLVFVTGQRNQRHIYKIQADGKQAAQLLSVETSAYERLAWSPDEQWLAVTMSERYAGAIYRVAANGSGSTLIYDDDAPVHRIVWSPDGKRIMFTTGRREQAALYWMNPDGSDVEYLTDVAFDWEMPISPVVDSPWHGATLLLASLTLISAAGASHYFVSSQR